MNSVISFDTSRICDDGILLPLLSPLARRGYASESVLSSPRRVLSDPRLLAKGYARAATPRAIFFFGDPGKPLGTSPLGTEREGIMRELHALKPPGAVTRRCESGTPGSFRTSTGAPESRIFFLPPLGEGTLFFPLFCTPRWYPPQPGLERGRGDCVLHSLPSYVEHSMCVLSPGYDQ